MGDRLVPLAAPIHALAAPGLGDLYSTWLTPEWVGASNLIVTFAPELDTTLNLAVRPKGGGTEKVAPINGGNAFLAAEGWAELEISIHSSFEYNLRLGVSVGIKHLTVNQSKAG